MKSSSRYGSVLSGEEAGDRKVQGELGLSRSMTIARRALVSQILGCESYKHVVPPLL